MSPVVQSRCPRRGLRGGEHGETTSDEPGEVPAEFQARDPREEQEFASAADARGLASVTCTRPIGAYRAPDGQVVFDSKAGWSDRPLSLPCGKCLGCKQRRAQEWAVRCAHESQLHESSIFVTLTYADEHLPPGGGLDHSHFREFMRRARRRVPGLRYFMSGEYGEELGRPHYHALVFGYPFPEERVEVPSKSKEPLWRSPEVDELWGKGNAPFGTVTFRSACYAAQYTIEKIEGPRAAGYYGDKRPPYCAMSRRPGIGAGWFDRFHGDVYPSDQVVIEGETFRPPRYYDLRLPEPTQQELRDRRVRRALQSESDRTPRRLRDREEVAKARMSLSGRHTEV